MVNLDQLKSRGLRAYETGRFRMAARVVLLLAPATAVASWLTSQYELCLCVGVLLALAAVWLRWRDRRGIEDVAAGLAAGGIPLAAGLCLTGLGFPCGELGCIAMFAAAGFLAGLLVAHRFRRRAAPLASWAAAISIAVAAAALGCTALGIFGMLGVTAGIAVGTGVGAALGPEGSRRGSQEM
jgi:hypothetical protein